MCPLSGSEMQGFTSKATWQAWNVFLALPACGGVPWRSSFLVSRHGVVESQYISQSVLIGKPAALQQDVCGFL